MNFIPQPRLQVYTKIVGKFDVLNKYRTFLYENSKILTIQVLWNLNEQNKNDINFFLLNEFFTQRRFNLKTTLNHFKQLLLTATLRKSYLFYYLEIFFNFYLINKPLSFKLDKNNYLTLYSLLSSKIELFTSLNNYQIYSKNLLVTNNIKFKTNLDFKTTRFFLNYYFLPVKKLGE